MYTYTYENIDSKTNFVYRQIFSCHSRGRTLMDFIPVKTRAFLPPKDDIFKLLDDYLPPLKEGDVLLVASKVLGIHEGRCVKIESTISKDALIRKEADAYIPRSMVPKRLIMPTIKHGIIVAFAGIDESNGNGYYIFWPKDPVASARMIRDYLKKKFKLRRLGVIVTDSYIRPLRAGVVGIAIGSYGIEPLLDYRGTKDIFGRTMKMEQTNIVDSIAAMGSFIMGEGNERRPFLIARGIEGIRFTDKPTYKKTRVSEKIDLYRPFVKIFKKTR